MDQRCSVLSEVQVAEFLQGGTMSLAERLADDELGKGMKRERFLEFANAVGMRGLDIYKMYDRHRRLGALIRDYREPKKPQHKTMWATHILLDILTLFLPYSQQQKTILDIVHGNEQASWTDQDNNPMLQLGLTYANVKSVFDTIETLLGNLTNDEETINKLLDVHVVGGADDEKQWVAFPPIDNETVKHLVGRWNSDGCDGYQQSASWWPVTMCNQVSPITEDYAVKWQLSDARPPRERMCEQCLRATILHYRILGPSKHGYFTVCL